MGVRWFAAVVSVCVLCSSGCGKEKPPLFDPATFSGMHQQAIMKDCAESLQCRAQMGMELPDDPMQACLEQSAERLESSSDIQQSFLRKFGRCMSYVVCDYYNCATSNVSGYGDSQRDKVMHDCTASIDCEMANGRFTGDKALALQGCVSTRTGTLDSFTMTQRQRYESVFMTCMPLNGCEFMNCFNGGAGVATMP